MPFIFLFHSVPFCFLSFRFDSFRVFLRFVSDCFCSQAARIEEERQEAVRVMVMEAQVKKEAADAVAAKLAAEEKEKEMAEVAAR